MASIDGWEKGGIFTWVKGSLGDKVGWTAMFYQWIHITVGMDTMMYVIIGALSITFGTPWFIQTKHGYHIISKAISVQKLKDWCQENNYRFPDIKKNHISLLYENLK